MKYLHSFLSCLHFPGVAIINIVHLWNRYRSEENFVIMEIQGQGNNCSTGYNVYRRVRLTSLILIVQLESLHDHDPAFQWILKLVLVVRGASPRIGRGKAGGPRLPRVKDEMWRMKWEGKLMRMSWNWRRVNETLMKARYIVLYTRSSTFVELDRSRPRI